MPRQDYVLHPESVLALERLLVLMQSRDYAVRSIKAYVQECRFLFAFYPEITAKEVRFAYRDYKDGNKAKEMTLSRGEFARRFALHILPRRLMKIRHYGYLSNHNRTTRLAKIRGKRKIPSLARK